MTTTRWVLVFLIAAVMFASPQSQAGDDGWNNGHRHRHHHHRHVKRESCTTDFWGKCYHVARHRHAYRWRYYHRRHHNHYRRWHPGSNERIDHGLICHARRRVVGEEAPSLKKAERAAENAWMGSVRYDHGERYQDINNAKDVRHNCDPSSTVRPGLGAKLFSRTFFRCVVEATPCRGTLETKGDRTERRYEEETDDDN